MIIFTSSVFALFRLFRDASKVRPTKRMTDPTYRATLCRQTGRCENNIVCIYDMIRLVQAGRQGGGRGPRRWERP